MNIRLFFIRLLPILIIVVAIGGFKYLKSTQPESLKAEAKEKVWQVSAVTIKPKSLSPLITLYGKVESPSLVKAAAPGDSIISKVWVRAGDKVKEGQRLVQLDPRDFQSDQMQAEADKADADAQIKEFDLKHITNQKGLEVEQGLLKLAQNDVKRLERLKRSNLSSESAISSAREKLGKQELAVLSRQLEVDKYPSFRQQLIARQAKVNARLKEVSLMIKRSTVIATFDAVVVDVPVAVGDRVRISDMLVSFYPLSSIELRAAVPVRYQAELMQSLNGSQSVIAEYKVEGQGHQLKLERLAGEATPGSIDAYFSFEQAIELKVGNLIAIDLQRPLQESVVALPFKAIYGSNRVFVLEDQRLKALTVEAVGQYRDETGTSLQLVRAADLQEGDQVVITHLPNATDGLKVELVSHDT